MHALWQNARHSRAVCPAANVVCRKCKKIGHFSQLCLTKSLHNITTAEKDDTEGSPVYYLGELEKADAPWTANIAVSKTSVEFKIDTGADVTVLPESLYRNSKWPTVIPTKINVRTASGSPLHVVGSFEAQLEYQTNRSTQNVYVVRGLQRPLLGRPAIKALNTLRRLYEIESVVDVCREFPKFFKGLGLFPGEYRICLKEGAIPFALSTPRRVPLPLMKAVKEELDRMLERGVISRVDGPTDWCAGMVVVPKPSSQRVCICVDLLA